MLSFIRRKFIDILIKSLLGNISDIPPSTLTKEQEDGLLSQMWENPTFRKRIADRDAKLIYQMAGGEGMNPEPRDIYALHAGQRVENLLLARDAKAAYTRLAKARETQRIAEEDGL